MSFLQFWHKEVMVDLEERKNIAIRVILPTLKRDCLFRRFLLVFLIWSKEAVLVSPEGSKKGIFLTDNYITIQVFSRAVLQVLSIPVQPLRLSPVTESDAPLVICFLTASQAWQRGFESSSVWTGVCVRTLSPNPGEFWLRRSTPACSTPKSCILVATYFSVNHHGSKVLNS